MLELTLKVLEYSAGSFTPEGGSQIDYSNAIVNFAGREYKMKSDINLDAFVGKEQDFTVAITPDKNRSPKFVIKAIV